VKVPACLPPVYLPLVYNPWATLPVARSAQQLPVFRAEAR
jgi:hypothetical protein